MRLAHVAEDVFVAAQNSEITLNSNHVDVLLNAVDRIIYFRAGRKRNCGWEGLHGSELNELVQGIAAIKSGYGGDKDFRQAGDSREKFCPKKAKPLSQPEMPAGKSKEPAGPDIKSRKKSASLRQKPGKKRKPELLPKPPPRQVQRAPEQEPKAASRISRRASIEIVSFA